MSGPTVLDIDSLQETGARIEELLGDLSAMIVEDDREAIASTFERIAAAARDEAAHVRSGAGGA